MAEREWKIELSKKAENNIDLILLYISQNSSRIQAQTFLRGFYDTLEDIKRFPPECMLNYLIWKIPIFAILSTINIELYMN